MPEFQDGSLKSILESKIKEVALITYVCRASRSYKVFGIQSLKDMFSVDERKVHKTLSGLIMKGALEGQMDLANQSLVITQQSTETEELQ